MINLSNWIKKNKLWAIIIIVLLFAVVISVLGEPEAVNKDNSSQQEKSATSKEDTSDLDLSIGTRVLSIEVTNNSDKPLENCEIRINPGLANGGYTKRADLPSKKPVDISYTEFLKGAEKFDTDKYAVKDIVVTDCKGQEARMAIFKNE